MSADRWSVCPRCALRTKKKKAKSRANLEAKYGKVYLAEWAKLRTKHLALIDEEMPTNFREDFEVLPLEDEEVVFQYSGSCKECKLSTKFEYTNIIKGVRD